MCAKWTGIAASVEHDTSLQVRSTDALWADPVRFTHAHVFLLIAPLFNVLLHYFYIMLRKCTALQCVFTSSAICTVVFCKQTPEAASVDTHDTDVTALKLLHKCNYNVSMARLYLTGVLGFGHGA